MTSILVGDNKRSLLKAKAHGFKGWSIEMIVILSVCVLLVGAIFAYWFIVHPNLNSKDVVFSYTAMIAAIVLFLLNAFLSLSSSFSEEKITTEITTYLEKGFDINSQRLSKAGSIYHYKNEISNGYGLIDSNFARNHAGTIAQSLYSTFKLEKLLQLAIITEIVEKKPDWKDGESQVMFGGSGITQYRTDDELGGDTKLTAKELAKSLKLDFENFKYENIKGKLFDSFIFPPNTSIKTSNDKNIVIENDYVKITIDILVNHGEKNIKIMNEYSDSEVVDALQFKANIYYRVIRKGMRAGSPNYSEYSDWINEIKKILEDRFSMR